jgi:tryptophanyl-tRNA synthetase
MSLTDPRKKMSKSDPNPNSRILITDDETTIRQKLRTALTDSLDGISYDPQSRPGIANLLDILRHCADDGGDSCEQLSGADLAADFKDSSLRSLKEKTADSVVKRLAEVRERFLQLRANPGELYEDHEENKRLASSFAGDTILAVKEAIGLRPIFDSSLRLK